MPGLAGDSPPGFSTLTSNRPLAAVAEDIRELPCYLNPRAEHLLDWFHITMRITVMTDMAKSLQPSWWAT